MKFKFLPYKSTLDELTFESKNKSYGAYVLRKAYDERMSIALSAVLIITFISTFLFLYLEPTYDYNERDIDLSKYTGFDLRLEKNILDHIPESSTKKNTPKPKKKENPPKKQDPQKDVKKPDKPVSDKIDYTKQTKTPPRDSIIKDSIIAAEKAKHVADSLLAAENEAKKQDSINKLGIDNGNKSKTMMTHQQSTMMGVEEFAAYIAQNFKPSPNPSERLNFSCTIFVYICITSDGTLAKYEIQKGVAGYAYYSNEVIRVIKEAPKLKAILGTSDKDCVGQIIKVKLPAYK